MERDVLPGNDFLSTFALWSKQNLKNNLKKTAPNSEYGPYPLVCYLPFRIHGQDIKEDDDIISSMIFGIKIYIYIKSI